jgi:predicted anti-sigma-YlaC factor YlaD
MRLKLNCRDTTRLVLEGEDRTLPLGERVLVRVHLGYCKGCSRFSKQVHLMRGALEDWRRQASGTDDAPPAR